MQQQHASLLNIRVKQPSKIKIMSRQEAVVSTSSGVTLTTTTSSAAAAIATSTTTATATTTCSKISTSTPQKRDESGTQDEQQQQLEFINRSLASEIDANDASAICCDLTINSINSSTSSGASPVAKRQMSSANVSRIRPQSSYSARVLIFDDSDQEAVAAAASASASAAALSATTSAGSGVELLPASPAKMGNDNSNGSSLIRNLNLTKSSSGGLSGSSSSLHSRGYTALLRKISYQQHTNSMRAVSSGKYLIFAVWNFI